MDVVDAEWIRVRLTGRHGEKAEIAAAIGITPVQLSRILSNERTISQDEAAKLRAHFSGQATPQPFAGFAESSVAPFSPKPRSTAAAMLAVVATHAERAEFYRARENEPSLGVIAGDLIVIDMKAEARTADLVICTVTDSSTGESTTHIRRWFDPWLIGSFSATQVNHEQQNAATYGRVIGVLRGDFLTDA